MKNQKKILCFVILCYLSGQSLQAKTSEHNNTALFVKVEVIVQDTSMLKDASIDFEMSKDGINSAYSKQVDFYSYLIKDSSTELSLPLSTILSYGRITFNYKNNILRRPLDYGNNLFIFQNKDSIKIIISKKDVLFDGKNKEIYNCLYRLQQPQIVSSSKANWYARQFKYDQYLETKKEQIDSLHLLRENILKEYRTKMSEDLYNLISADCLGLYNSQLLGILLINTIDQNTERYSFYEAVQRFYVKRFKNSLAPSFSIKILASSYRYADFLSEKDKAWILLNRKDKTFKTLYDIINESYTGIIRDKVLLLAVYKSINVLPDTKVILKEITTSHLNIYMTAIKNIVDHNVDGDAFDFKLPDERGRIVRLTDFKGKIVIIDFWFTGCTACRNLAEEMKSIKKYFLTNPDIVFISVNIDQKKQYWLKSLKEGKYSNEEDVNLYAEMGRFDPMLKYYNIDSFPTLIVISKKGKVITTAPPKPRKDIEGSVEAFKRYINQYLVSI